MPISDSKKHAHKDKNTHDILLEISITNRWFTNLPTDIQKRLLRVFETREYARGECIIAADQGANGMYCVLTGMVFMTTARLDARTSIPFVVDPQHWFGLVEVINGCKYPLTAMAAKDTKLIFISTINIESISRQYPGIWRDIGKLLAQQTMLLANNIIELIYSPAPARLAKRLVALSRQEGGAGSIYRRRIIHINHDQLGAMLSISRQMICRILKEFEKGGLLKRGYNAIEIRNVDGLRARFETCGRTGHPERRAPVRHEQAHEAVLPRSVEEAVDDPGAEPETGTLQPSASSRREAV